MPAQAITMTTLDRAIGPLAATLLVIGSIIGSGIFLTTGAMAQALPSAPLLLLAWVVGSLLALFGALTYAEMATMFPHSGGVYVFLREAFGSLPGFLYGWATLLVVLAGGIAAVAVGFADYFSYFFPGAVVLSCRRRSAARFRDDPHRALAIRRRGGDRGPGRA